MIGLLLPWIVSHQRLLEKLRKVTRFNVVHRLPVFPICPSYLRGVSFWIGLSAGIAQVSQSDSLAAFSQTRKSRRVPRL